MSAMSSGLVRLALLGGLFATGFFGAILADAARADVSEREKWHQCMAMMYLGYPDSASYADEAVTAYTRKFGVTREEALKERANYVQVAASAVKISESWYQTFADLLEDSCPRTTGIRLYTTGKGVAISWMKARLQPDAARAERERMAEDQAAAQRRKVASRCDRFTNEVASASNDLQRLIDNPGTHWQQMHGLNGICQRLRWSALRLRHFNCDGDLASRADGLARESYDAAVRITDRDFPGENAPLTCYSAPPAPVGYDE